MKATEQYFLVVLLIMLYRVALTFESVDEIIKCGHSNQFLPVVLFNMLNKAVLTFESVEKILKYDHLNQS